MISRRLVFGIGLSLTACGGNARPADTAQAVIPPGAAASDHAGAMSKRPSIAPPPKLSAVVRVRDVMALASRVGKTKGVAPSEVDLIARHLVGGVSRLSDLHAPAVVALMDEGGPIPAIVVSFAADAANAEKELATLPTKSAKGMRLFDHDNEFVPKCAVPEKIAAGTRITCGDSEERIRAVAPYLEAEAAAWDRSDDVSLEVLVATVRDKKDAIKKSANQAVGGDAGDALTKQLDKMSDSALADADRFELGATWTDGGFTLRSRVHMPTANSPSARAMISQASNGVAPDEALGKLPGDVQFAFATRGLDPASSKPLHDEVLEALAKSIGEDGYTPAVTSKIVDLLGGTFFTGGSWAVGWGVDTARVDQALVASAAQKDGPAGRAQVAKALDSYTLVSIHEAPERWIGLAKTFADVADAKSQKDRAQEKDKKTDDKAETSTTRIAAPSKDLPAGNVHVVHESKPVGKKAPPAHAVHVFVTGNGGDTWIGGAEDEALAVAKLKEVIAGAKKPLGAVHPEIAKETGATGARSLAFGTIAGWRYVDAKTETAAQIAELRKSIASDAALPAHGKAPMFFVDRVLPDGTARTIEWTVQIDAAGVGDIAAVFADAKDTKEK